MGRVVRANSPDVPLFEIKRAHELNAEAQALRREVIRSGKVDTTSLRSEFKHYLTEDETNRIIQDLKRKYPPRFDTQGKLVSGISSRDNRVRLRDDEIVKILGPE